MAKPSVDEPATQRCGLALGNGSPLLDEESTCPASPCDGSAAVFPGKVINRSSSGPADVAATDGVGPHRASLALQASLRSDSCGEHADSERYHRGWARWVASNLLRGVAPTAITKKMVANGFSDDFAARQIQATRASPIYEAAFATADRAKKLGYLLEVLGELQAIAPVTIDRINTVDHGTFLRSYVAQNRPVVLEGLANDWPARKWTFSHLAAVLGDTEIDVACDRASDPRYEDNFRSHVRQMSFSRFIEQIEQRETANDIYLVSKNRLLRHPRASTLLHDIPKNIEVLGSAASHADAGIWIGPAGTVTPLHHDACNILFVQIVGRKRLHLIAPLYITRIYNDRSCFTDFDPETPDYERFPQMRGVPIATTELKAGDALLLPVGWWHHVRALDPSVSLSFPQFTLRRSAHVWKWREERQHA